MTQARIYQPTSSAMQAGSGGNTNKWVLEYEPDSAREIDPLMGWIGSSDTNAQVRLKFDSKDQAVAFAENNALSYQVREPNLRRVRPKNYADSFSFHQVK